MIRIAVPATSANLGVGFDTFALAYELYNYFEVELSDKWEFEGFEERFANEDNLFVVAYKRALKKMGVPEQKCKVKIEAHIPVGRGLGSSAAVIVGGLFAANHFNDYKLTKLEMLEIANDMEGHPDNSASAIYGNVTICNNNNGLLVVNKQVHPSWKFGLWVTDFELSTEMARSVLPQNYLRNDVVNNISSAVLAIEALTSGDESLIPLIMNDKIHEPYRSKLIEGFEEVKAFAMGQGANAFIISGSGSTCMSIQKHDLASTEFKNWKCLNLKAANEGAHLCQKDS